MRTVLTVFMVTLLACGNAGAAGRTVTVTYYLDAAKVEYKLDFKSGYVETAIPKGALLDSLRIKPLDGTLIERVATAPEQTNGVQREIKLLEQRKTLLSDRLKVLLAREEILRAAAKSQSSRAPRKTKNNPDPIVTIRQGTDFAMNRLESTVSARLKTERELVQTDASLSSKKGLKGDKATICQIWLSRKRGRVELSYLNPQHKWTPVYDFRVNKDAKISMTMRASFPDPGKGVSARVVPAKYGEAEQIHRVKHDAKAFDKVFEHTFAVDKEVMTAGPAHSFTFSFHNLTDRSFPAGDAACFRQGEFLGHGRFNGMVPNEAVIMTFGSSGTP